MNINCSKHQDAKMRKFRKKGKEKNCSKSFKDRVNFPKVNLRRIFMPRWCSDVLIEINEIS